MQPECNFLLQSGWASLKRLIFIGEIFSMTRRLLFLVSEDAYFVLHRLPMAKAAQRAGFEVHVATHVTRHGSTIEAQGFVLHPMQLVRGSLSPLDLAGDVRRVHALYRQLRPDVAHHVSLQAVLTGAIAALGVPLACLNGFTGLGYVYASRDFKAWLVRAVLRLVFPWLMRRKRSLVLVENADDRRALMRGGIPGDRITVCRGSGIDIDRFTPLPEPAGPVTVAFVGRIIGIKGVRDLVAAQRVLAARGRAVEVLLAGSADPANPSAIPVAEIEAWSRGGDLHWLRHVEDVREVWARAHVAVLPSRGGEGVPLALLEAAACGRPLIATDVPGCRDIVRDGATGLLVPAADPCALADAIDRLAGDRDLRRRLGAGARDLAVAEFSSVDIGREVVALYEGLLPSIAARP